LRLLTCSFASALDDDDSKHLAPEYAKAATMLKSEEPPIQLAKVDATIESELASRFGVSGYPTLKIFRKGTPTDFDGPREANGIVKKLRSLNGAAAAVLETTAALDKFVANENEIGIVAFVKAGSAEATTLSKLADQHREDFRFALVNDEKIAKHAGVKMGTYVVYRPATFETRKEETPAKGSVEDLKKASAFVACVRRGHGLTHDFCAQFVLKNAVPLAGVYDASNTKTYSLVGLVSACVCVCARALLKHKRMVAAASCCLEHCGSCQGAQTDRLLCEPIAQGRQRLCRQTVGE
jgi:protein disulfide-isomerase A4